MVSEAQHEIDLFIKKVEEKLPGYLGDNSQERKEILAEMEEHIWDKAEELAKDSDPTMDEIREAIAGMGSPDRIAKEFKKRGTPKVYIYEEWWEWYLKVLGIVMLCIGGFAAISVLFSIGRKTFFEILGAFIEVLWTGGLFGLIIVTVIFVALSMHGYLPQDLKDHLDDDDSINLKGIKVKIDKTFSSKSSYDSEHQKEKYQETYNRAMGKSVSTERPKYHYEYKLKNPRKKTDKKAPIKRGSLLSDAIWGIIWNIFFIIQPIESLNQYLTPAFLDFIQLTAAVALAIAIMKFMQVFAGMYRVSAQQVIQTMILVTALIVIPIYLDFLENPQAMLMFSDAVNFDWRPSTTLVRIVIWISIVVTVIESLEKLSKVISYPRRLREYTVSLEAIQSTA